MDLCPADQRKEGFSLSYLGVNLGVAIGPMCAGLLFERHLPWLLDSALAGVARCLSESKPRIKEVAVKFGFNSPGHLSRMFRRAYGLSPRDFANGVHRR